MKPLSIHRPYFGLAGVAFCLLEPALHADCHGSGGNRAFRGSRRTSA